jgi:hypothetical protein
LNYNEGDTLEVTVTANDAAGPGQSTSARPVIIQR